MTNRPILVACLLEAASAIAEVTDDILSDAPCARIEQGISCHERLEAHARAAVAFVTEGLTPDLTVFSTKGSCWRCRAILSGYMVVAAYRRLAAALGEDHIVHGGR